MTQIRFDGRVAIVTGAGNGLGRCYALALAERGAKVVVNDIDAGEGGGARRVVEEIRQKGGIAMASTDSVQHGGRIVEAALACFGRVDIVINNAGLLRDAAFHRMRRDDWADVQDVHLNGAFEVTRAAWPHLRGQGWGRVLMTTSIAGVHGNFGQANYAAAKLGLFGLVQTLAIEGREKGIRVNAVAPLAASRLTEAVLPADMLSRLAPEHVVPLVMVLAGESCPVTGQLFEAGGGCFARLRWERSRVLSFPEARVASPEDVLQGWPAMREFDGDDHPSAVADGFALIDRRQQHAQAGADQPGDQEGIQHG